MNRTQRAKVRALRKAQNLAKERVRTDILICGRGYEYLKCDSKAEKEVRNEVRKLKVAINTPKEAVIA